MWRWLPALSHEWAKPTKSPTYKVKLLVLKQSFFIVVVVMSLRISNINFKVELDKKTSNSFAQVSEVESWLLTLSENALSLELMPMTGMW